MPASLFELSDNASISAGLVEAAVNAGKSEDEIGAALAGWIIKNWLVNI